MSYEREQVRFPTEKEFKAAAECLTQTHIKHFLEDDELEPWEVLQGYTMFCISNYCSDVPGYAGKIFVIIWGEPHFVTTLTEEVEESVGKAHDGRKMLVRRLTGRLKLSTDCEGLIRAISTQTTGPRTNLETPSRKALTS